EQSPLRVWAIEGTGGHGAGLTHLLAREDEVVFALDRPRRAMRRNGAKSDPLDAVRAAREAMARPHHATPRTGRQRQALSVLLATRRSAVEAVTTAQRQDRKSTRLNSSHVSISYAVFCLKKQTH